MKIPSEWNDITFYSGIALETELTLRNKNT